MSYRVYIGVVKKSDLDKHLSKNLSDSDEDYDEKWDFFRDSRQTEIFDETPIEDCKIINGYEDEEYPPYLLSKSDFQEILNFYKKHLMEVYDKKEKEFKDDKKDFRELANISFFYSQVKSYFNELIIKDKNVVGSMIFLLDYFNLVRMYENMGDADIALITHG